MRCSVKECERSRREYRYTVDSRSFVVKDFIYALDCALPEEYEILKRGEEYHVLNNELETPRLELLPGFEAENVAAKIRFYKNPKSSEMNILVRKSKPAKWLPRTQDWKKDSLDEIIEMVLSSIPNQQGTKSQQSQSGQLYLFPTG